MAWVAVLGVASLVTLLWPRLVPALLGLDGVLVLAVLVDRWRTPDPRRLVVERAVPERAGLDQPFERRVRVSAASAAGLELEVREEFPASLEVVERSHDGVAAAPRADDPTGGPDRARLGDGATVLARRYRGRVRGLQSLGRLRLRLRSPWGLVQRQAEHHGPQAIAIDPPLAGLSRVLRLAASERWQDLGVRRLARRGGPTEFESLREYVQGDDLNRVDWKAFARRATPIVREYQEERGQELLVLIDAGRRMAQRSGSAGWTRLDHALDVGLELAAVALQAGDRVGVAVFDRGLRVYVPPRKGGRQLLRLKEAVFAEQPSTRESDVGRALRELSVRHRRRALVVMLSELADPLSVEHQRRALSAGSRRHPLVLATLDDPALRATCAGGAEVPAAERAVALSLERERARGLAVLRRSGARVLDTLPAEAAAPLLGAWLDARRGRLARTS